MKLKAFFRSLALLTSLLYFIVEAEKTADRYSWIEKTDKLFSKFVTAFQDTHTRAQELALSFSSPSRKKESKLNKDVDNVHIFSGVKAHQEKGKVNVKKKLKRLRKPVERSSKVSNNEKKGRTFHTKRRSDKTPHNKEEKKTLPRRVLRRRNTQKKPKGDVKILPFNPVNPDQVSNQGNPDTKDHEYEYEYREYEYEPWGEYEYEYEPWGEYEYENGNGEYEYEYEPWLEYEYEYEYEPWPEYEYEPWNGEYEYEYENGNGEYEYEYEPWLEYEYEYEYEPWNGEYEYEYEHGGEYENLEYEYEYENRQFIKEYCHFQYEACDRSCRESIKNHAPTEEGQALLSCISEAFTKTAKSCLDEFSLWEAVECAIDLSESNPGLEDNDKVIKVQETIEAVLGTNPPDTINTTVDKCMDGFTATPEIYPVVCAVLVNQADLENFENAILADFTDHPKACADFNSIFNETVAYFKEVHNVEEYEYEGLEYEYEYEYEGLEYEYEYEYEPWGEYEYEYENEYEPWGEYEYENEYEPWREYEYEYEYEPWGEYEYEYEPWNGEYEYEYETSGEYEYEYEYEPWNGEYEYEYEPWLEYEYEYEYEPFLEYEYEYEYEGPEYEYEYEYENGRRLKGTKEGSSEGIRDKSKTMLPMRRKLRKTTNPDSTVKQQAGSGKAKKEKYIKTTDTNAKSNVPMRKRKKSKISKLNLAEKRKVLEAAKGKQIRKRKAKKFRKHPHEASNPGTDGKRAIQYRKLAKNSHKEGIPKVRRQLSEGESLIDSIAEMKILLPHLQTVIDECLDVHNVDIIATMPTNKPTTAPTTSEPTISPTLQPSVSPTKSPTTSEPTVSPTVTPTTSPTVTPTTTPTATPTLSPSLNPTTSEPTVSPTPFTCEQFNSGYTKKLRILNCLKYSNLCVISKNRCFTKTEAPSKSPTTPKPTASPIPFSCDALNSLKTKQRKIECLRNFQECFYDGKKKQCYIKTPSPTPFPTTPRPTGAPVEFTCESMNVVPLKNRRKICQKYSACSFDPKTKSCKGTVTDSPTPDTSTPAPTPADTAFDCKKFNKITKKNVRKKFCEANDEFCEYKGGFCRDKPTVPTPSPTSPTPSPTPAATLYNCEKFNAIKKLSTRKKQCIKIKDHCVFQNGKCTNTP